MRLFISPNFRGLDPGSHGGIRRVIDAQKEYFASSLVDSPEDADTIAIHAGSLVPLRSDQKVITHCHGFYWNKHQWGTVDHHAINRDVIAAIKTADLLTAPTEWVADVIRKGAYRDVAVIPHGVDHMWFTSTYESDGYVLWNKSRIDSVCDDTPVHKVAGLLPNVKFKLTVTSRLPGKNIEVTGLTSYADKAPVQKAGVYLATAQETFGIGILEALASGVPVVGWNWGGQSDILPKDWLAQEGNYEHLARLIQWALDHRTDLREQCIEIASKYTWKNAMQQYEELYALDVSHPKRLSVIIRNYATEEYLADAIDSVVPQLTDEDECIVVDDCSPDAADSQRITTEHGADWVQTPKNLHLSGALNHGMSIAQGRYILQLDADNMIEKNTIKHMVAALDANRGLDIVYGRVNWVNETNEPVRMQSDWPPPIFNFSRQLSHMNQLPCASMYRRKVYDIAGPYRNRCRVAEDADFWCRATSLGFVPKQVLDTPVLRYRVRNSVSANTPDWPWEKWYDWQSRPPFISYGNRKPEVFSGDPLVLSIIIPVGPGHELYLQDALDSIYMQTFKNWECIVLNDTGGVLPWLPPWAQEVLVSYDKPVGPSKARNEGLDRAKGFLSLFLDADDYLTSSRALEKMLRVWRNNPHSYVFTDHMHGDNVIERHADQVCNIIKARMPHIFTGIYPILSGIRFNDMIGEDWDYCLQFTSQGYCGLRVPEPLVYYRHESGSRRVKFMDSQEEIRKKWEDVQFTMCGCQDRTANQGLFDVETASMLGPSDAGVVMIKYIGEEPKRYFTGSVSGRTYTFGTIPALQEKYVLVEDLPGFNAQPARFAVPISV